MRGADSSIYAPLLPTELESILGGTITGINTGSTRIYPVATCWPMGHCWSSAISQHVMTDCCIAAGVPEDAFLCDASGLPTCDAMAVSVATDDVILFERSGNDAFVAGDVAPIFSQLDNIWTDRGIQSKESKHIDRVADGVALGLQLSKGKHLVPKAERLYDILCILTLLLTEQRTSQKQFATFFGVLQWTMLVNRPLLSSCHHIYGFRDTESDTIVDIPTKVLDELGLISTLLFATAVDLAGHHLSGLLMEPSRSDMVVHPRPAIPVLQSILHLLCT